MSTRRWIERGVVVVAAVASMATSRKKWELYATLPAKDARAQVIVVEASQEPEVYTRSDHLQPLEPGSTRYLVPAGAQLDSIFLRGHDCSGRCGGDCPSRAESYVRVAIATPVATWTREIAGARQSIELKPNRRAWQTVALSGTPANRHVRVDGSLAPSAVHDWGNAVTINWPSVDKPTTVTWTPHVVLEGPCPGLEPCAAPATASVDLDVREGFDD